MVKAPQAGRRPPRDDQHGGVVVAAVEDNRDPRRRGRVKVRFPWRSGERTGWARLAVPMAGDRVGTYFLPEVGDEVLVAFERGDPRRPYVLGSLWSAEARPPESNPRTRLIRSRNGHELRFFDGEPGVVELKLNDGRRLRLDDGGVALDDANGNRLEIDTGTGGLTIESAASLTIKSPRISIEAGATMEIKAAGTLTSKGGLVQIN